MKKKIIAKIKKKVSKKIEKIAIKYGAKKGTAKFVAKRVWGVGFFVGLGYGLSELAQGNYKKAGMEITSGTVGLVPGYGTLASLAIDLSMASSEI